jgi:hypothetical protein
MFKGIQFVGFIKERKSARPMNQPGYPKINPGRCIRTRREMAETMLDELRSRSRHILESTKGSFHGPSHLDPKIPDGTWLSGLRSCTFLQQQG